MLKPKFGLLGVLMDNFYDQDNGIDNLQFVPISLNYSRVLEGESFPRELTGLPKLKETLSRIINSFSTLKMNFGDILIKIGEPIDFNLYQEQLCLKYNYKPHEVKADKKKIV